MGLFDNSVQLGFFVFENNCVVLFDKTYLIVLLLEYSQSHVMIVFTNDF